MSHCGGSPLNRFVGVPGPRGPKGEKGDPGSGAGDPGPKGDKGDPGVPGADGKDGVDGLRGEKGSDGADGAPGRDGVDGQDGVLDPDLAPVKPQPELSDEVVIVDGGVVKRSPWSAFKARLELWLTDLEAVWSGKTLVDPKVQGLISFDVRDDAAERVNLQTFRASNGNLSFRLTKSDGSQFFVINQNGGPAYTGRFGFTMEETNGLGRIQVFSPSGNTGITLQPQGTGSVNVGGSGGLTVAGVPVVTTTGVQAISNKTLNAPTLNDPVLNNAVLKNPITDGLLRVRNEVNGKLVFQVNQDANAVNGLIITGANSLSKTPQIVGFGDDADVGIRLLPKGEGEIFAGPALDRVSVKRNAIPASATDVGKPGWWAEDDSFLYVYIGDGTVHAWRRAALQTW